MALPWEPGIAGATRNAAHHAVNWLELATVIYAIIAGVLLLRLAIGLYLTWRLVPRRDTRCMRHGRPARTSALSGRVAGRSLSDRLYPGRRPIAAAGIGGEAKGGARP